MRGESSERLDAVLERFVRLCFKGRKVLCSNNVAEGTSELLALFPDQWHRLRDELFAEMKECRRVLDQARAKIGAPFYTPNLNDAGQVNGFWVYDLAEAGTHPVEFLERPALTERFPQAVWAYQHAPTGDPH